MLRKLFGPMSQSATHATGDMDVCFFCLCVSWMFGFCLCVSGNQAHGVQKVEGSWQVSPLDPESAATDSPWWKSRAGRMNTAPVNRRRRDEAMRTNEPHVSRLGMFIRE